MRNKFFVSLAAVSLLTLAACGEGEKKSEQAPATTEQPAPRRLHPLPRRPSQPKQKLRQLRRHR